MLLRCEHTNNPCGTDTWVVGKPCQCQGCQAWLEIERLRAALQTYGEHTTSCKAMFTKDHDDCDCGWKEVLDTVDEQTTIKDDPQR